MINKGDIVKLDMSILHLYEEWYRKKNGSFVFFFDTDDKASRWLVDNDWVLKPIGENSIGVGFSSQERPLWLIFFEVVEDSDD